MRLINADALSERICFVINNSKELVTSSVVRKAVLVLIAIQPTIEAEPVRHGRWIKMTGMMPPEYHGHYECSECHWHMKGIRSSWTREEELTYCPNCGVIMDGGGEGER